MYMRRVRLRYVALIPNASILAKPVLTPKRRTRKKSKRRKDGERRDIDEHVPWQF